MAYLFGIIIPINIVIKEHNYKNGNVICKLTNTYKAGLAV